MTTRFLKRYLRGYLPLVFLILPIQTGCSEAHPSTKEDSAVLLIAGDTHFGENYAAGAKQGSSAAAAVRYDEALSNLQPLLASSDLVIVNLETPLSGWTSEAMVAKQYTHWSNPELAGAALRTASVDAVSLANNHSLDQGREGLRKTLSQLASSDIKAFGAGEDLNSSRAPFLADIVLSEGREVTVAVFGMFEEREQYRTKHNFYADPTQSGAAPIDIDYFRDAAAKLRKTHPGIFIIAFPHWGANYSWVRKEQISLGRGLIDAGADIVIGHHAHVVQEIEKYRGKWILYGIGNFYFGSPGRYAQNSFVLPYSILVELALPPGPEAEPSLALYPIMSDNRTTGYRPRQATLEETTRVLSALQARRRSNGLERAIVKDRGKAAAIILQ